MPLLGFQTGRPPSRFTSALQEKFFIRHSIGERRDNFPLGLQDTFAASFFSFPLTTIFGLTYFWCNLIPNHFFFLPASRVI